MRVLHVSNHSVDRCGIANFGRQLSTALRRAGCEVTDWDGQYSTIYGKVQRGEPAYLPADAEAYDVIHFNWHPITINHYGPGHFPSGPLLSIYLNDIPPWSGCPAVERADVLIAAEPSPGCHVIPYPICDWVTNFPRPSAIFTVGWSVVRGDGAAQVRETCERLGYTTNPSHLDQWLSYEEEIQRLARSSVNVCWYHEGRGISGGASQLSSSRRPLILSNSPMFAHLRAYGDEYYHGWGGAEPSLDELLQWAYLDWRVGDGRMRKPQRVLDDLSWSRAAAQLIAIWKEARRV